MRDLVRRALGIDQANADIYNHRFRKGEEATAQGTGRQGHRAKGDRARTIVDIRIRDEGGERGALEDSKMTTRAFLRVLKSAYVHVYDRKCTCSNVHMETHRLRQLTRHFSVQRSLEVSSVLHLVEPYVRG
jgi:hypothetical protein